MTRRDLFKLVVGAFAARAAAPLLPKFEPSVFVPYPKETLFMAGFRGGKNSALMGIPYHVSNASTREWLGFMRVQSEFMMTNPRQCGIITEIGSDE